MIVIPDSASVLIGIFGTSGTRSWPAIVTIGTGVRREAGGVRLELKLKLKLKLE